MNIKPVKTLLMGACLLVGCTHNDLGSKNTHNNKGTLYMENAEEEVIKAVETMTAAFHAGDIEGVMASYEEQATVVFEPGKPVSDRTALRQGFTQFFALQPRFTYSGHEVFVAGDTAMHIAPWTMQGTTPDGTAIEQSGLSVAVLRRQADGRWLMVLDDPHGQHLTSGPSKQ